MFLKNQKYRTKIPTTSLHTIATRMSKEIGDLRAPQIEILINYYFHEVCRELKKGNEVWLGMWGRFKMSKKDAVFFNPKLKTRKMHRGHIKVNFRAFKKMMETLRGEGDIK